MTDRKPRGRPKGTPKTGGRKRGTPNKITTEVREAAAEIVDSPAYRRNLIARAESGTLAPALECLLWYFAKGKPKEVVEHHAVGDIAKMSDAELEGALRGCLAKLESRAIPAATE
jgi:hypothetical protein